MKKQIITSSRGYSQVFNDIKFLLDKAKAQAYKAVDNIRVQTYWQIGERIVIAGAISYIVSQTHDVFSFSFWKKLTKGKHLWLRNNLSTIVSQLIDSILFISIVFLGVLPLNSILTTIFGVFIIKVIIAICDTPFVYLLVRWARS